MLDQKREARYRFYQNKESIVDINISMEGDQVLVLIDGSINVGKVRVFGTEGEIESQRIGMNR